MVYMKILIKHIIGKTNSLYNNMSPWCKRVVTRIFEKIEILNFFNLGR